MIPTQECLHESSIQRQSGRTHALFLYFIDVNGKIIEILFVNKYYSVIVCLMSTNHFIYVWI